MEKCDGCNRISSGHKMLSSYYGSKWISIYVCDKCFNEVRNIVGDMKILEYYELRDRNNAIEIFKERLVKFCNKNLG